MRTPNTLPVWTVEDDRWADLPLHVHDVVTHECIHCGDAPIWDSYEAYLEHWYAFEYEGDPWHAPSERDEWELGSNLCCAAVDVEPLTLPVEVDA